MAGVYPVATDSAWNIDDSCVGCYTVDTPEKRKQLEQLAEEILELSQFASMARTQANKNGDFETMTDAESFTLKLLIKNETMTVGELQKAIGVLPAQMSRVIRSLEDKGGIAYISCSINSNDRRKIDVSVTEEGLKAYNAFRSARLESSVQTLSVLSQKDRDEFMRILRVIRGHVAKRMAGK